MFTIDVVSDVICPWCFIGKRRLEKALKLLGAPLDVRVAWRPRSEERRVGKECRL